MSDRNTLSSGQTLGQLNLTERERWLLRFTADVRSMLQEKVAHYGEVGGFYETNGNGDYSHAIGEAKLKLAEFQKIHHQRDLIKAITWLYLIYEMENHAQPRP